jgi:hypothetical protein
MDGINPTLAFAALFLGLSGHPRDVAEQPAQPEHTTNWESPAPTDQQIGYLVDCPGTAVAAHDENAPAGFGPLQDRKVALTGSVLVLEPHAAKTPSISSDLSSEIFHDQDGCGELTPQP